METHGSTSDATLDFGTAEARALPQTEPVAIVANPRQETTTSSVPVSTELPFGDSRGSHTPHTAELAWNRFYKFYQLWVLLILLASLGVLIWFDYYVATIAASDSALSKKDYLDKILPVVVPVFTFLLGMTTRQRVGS
jgi:hypothetical protein